MKITIKIQDLNNFAKNVNSFYFPQGIIYSLIDNNNNEHYLGQFLIKQFKEFTELTIKNRPQTLYELKQLARKHSLKVNEYNTTRNIVILSSDTQILIEYT